VLETLFQLQRLYIFDCVDNGAFNGDKVYIYKDAITDHSRYEHHPTPAYTEDFIVYLTTLFSNKDKTASKERVRSKR
jgi:hypothetical protein